jgi:thiol-disulfide isomerase/thioredoxin
MKTNILILALTTITLFISCNTERQQSEAAFAPNPVIVEEQEIISLEPGAQAPAFRLPDMYGRFVTLEDFKDARLLVIAFICNHCPTAQAYEDRLIAFTNDYRNKGVSVVAINPTSMAGLLPEECGYSDLDDSFETMSVRAEFKGYNFPYLYDGDDQAVSISYGPQATPHVMVFDAERKLRYSGRIDGIERPGTANAEDLRLAVDQILADEEVSNPVTKSFGCSIKWSWKSDWADRINKEWLSRSVDLKLIDEEAIGKLLANDSGKLRLINVWATWCAPCIIELPELALVQRYYGNRPFELVTISADQTDKADNVLRMLKDKHLPVQNFLFNADDKYKMIEAIDPQWSGALPYTLLIEPGGNVIFKHQGLLDMLALKRTIVEHPLLGRYF